MYIAVVFNFFFFKQKTAYEMRISDWSSDVCSSDLGAVPGHDRIVADRGDRRTIHRAAGDLPVVRVHGRQRAPGAVFQPRDMDVADLVDGAVAIRQQRPARGDRDVGAAAVAEDRKSTRLNSSH